MDDEIENKLEKCIILSEIENAYRAKIPGIVDAIIESCSNEKCFDHVDATVIPSKDSVIEILDIIRNILYPGYF
ncbi:MAG: serine O-acetyltransferase, partial [Candidatus Methanocomedens sp.]